MYKDPKVLKKMDAFQIQDHYCEVFLFSPNTSVKHVKNGGNYSTLKLWEIARIIA